MSWAPTAAPPEWYFTEGSRKGELFSNYFMVFNPTQGPVTLSFGFFATDAERQQTASRTGRDTPLGLSSD